MIVRTTDRKIIEKVLRMDNLWKDMQEEGTPFKLIINHDMWYLPILTEDKQIAGIAATQWLGNRLIYWHFGLLRQYRGKDSQKYGKEAIQYIDDLVPNVRHMTLIPTYKPHVIEFAKRVGFKERHIIEKSIEKKDKLYDRILLEI